MNTVLTKGTTRLKLHNYNQNNLQFIRISQTYSLQPRFLVHM